MVSSIYLFLGVAETVVCVLCAVGLVQTNDPAFLIVLLPALVKAILFLCMSEFASRKVVRTMLRKLWDTGNETPETEEKDEPTVELDTDSDDDEDDL